MKTLDEAVIAEGERPAGKERAMTKASASKKQYADNNVSRGLCAKCPRPVANGRSLRLCPYHLEKDRGYDLKRPDHTNKWRAQHRASGLCVCCCAPHLPNRSVCQYHLERKQFYRNKGKASFNPNRSCDLYYPYDQNGNCSLLQAINRAVPKSLPESVRPEVCQDIAVAVLEGSIEPDSIANHLTRFVKAAFRNQPMKFGHVSLEWLREVRGDCI